MPPLAVTEAILSVKNEGEAVVWTALKILESGNDAGDLYPVLGDDLEVMPEPLDGGFDNVFEASAIKVERKIGGVWSTDVSADDVKINMFVTSGRIVFHSRKWVKGATWIGFGVGGLAVAAVATAIEKGVAAHRRRGNALAGHIRYEWLAQVGWRPKSFLIPPILLLVYKDATDQNHPLGRLTLQFKGRADLDRIARLITDKSVAYRYASSEEFTPEHLAKWEILRTSGIVSPPSRGSVALYSAPFFYFVGNTAFVRPTSPPRFPAVERSLK